MTASLLPLLTRRLLIRHLHIQDAGALYRVFGDPEVMRHSEGVRTLDWVQEWLLTCLAQARISGLGPYAVVERQNQMVIGYCGLF